MQNNRDAHLPCSPPRTQSIEDADFPPLWGTFPNAGSLGSSDAIDHPRMFTPGATGRDTSPVASHLIQGRFPLYELPGVRPETGGDASGVYTMGG